MTTQLIALCFDADDPSRLARFWAVVLGWEPADGSPGNVVIRPGDSTGFGIRFLQTNEQKTSLNQMHLDLTSASLEAQQETVARALEVDRLVSLGATCVDVGRSEGGRVAMLDPDGNEFCVVPVVAAMTT